MRRGPSIAVLVLAAVRAAGYQIEQQTVIVVADRLDEVTLSWQINREKNMLRDIGVAMNPPVPPR